MQSGTTQNLSNSLSGDTAGGNDSHKAMEALAAEGRYQEAVDMGTRLNRVAPEPELEAWLVRMRHRACFKASGKPSQGVWPPPPPPDMFESATGLAETDVDGLSVETLSSGMAHHGAVHVRGLISRERAAILAGGIDRAMEGYDAWSGGAAVKDLLPWFAPFRSMMPDPGRKMQGLSRYWIREAGGVLTADSPRMLFEYFETLYTSGLHRLIEEYLGERPWVSVRKSTLRRVPASMEIPEGGGWHQDGAFMNPDGSVRTLNVWLCLSDCGEDAPGMELLPRRPQEILPTGTEGAPLDWAVGPGVVEREAARTPTVRPRFCAGDAVLFDDLNLHRTYITPGMSKSRYAIETWFFAPSGFPPGYMPILA